MALIELRFPEPPITVVKVQIVDAPLSLKIFNSTGLTSEIFILE